MVSLPPNRNMYPEQLQASMWLKLPSPAVPSPGPFWDKDFLSPSAAKNWEVGAEQTMRDTRKHHLLFLWSYLIS